MQRVTHLSAFERKGTDVSSIEPEKPQYRTSLRIVGIWLDEQRPARITLLESASGFIAILAEESSRPIRSQRDFSFEELRQTSESESWHLLRPRFGKVTTGASLADIGYARALFAVGRVLDDIECGALVLDELDDGLLVSYSFLDGSQGYHWRRHTTQMPFSEIWDLVNADSGMTESESNRGDSGWPRSRQN